MFYIRFRIIYAYIYIYIYIGTPACTMDWCRAQEKKKTHTHTHAHAHAHTRTHTHTDFFEPFETNKNMYAPDAAQYGYIGFKSTWSRRFHYIHECRFDFETLATSTDSFQTSYHCSSSSPKRLTSKTRKLRRASIGQCLN